MTLPDIAATWTWTGDRTLPDWLTGYHHWHADRPTVHTVDGPRALYTGWLVALWTDGVITVGSNTVADRVYGPDGLAGRLQRAEAALDRPGPAAGSCSAPGPRTEPNNTGPAATQATEPAWTPPPPGDTREQLPEHLLNLIRGSIPDYLSTACVTADTLAVAVHWSHPQRAEVGQWAERLHQRCRRNQKFTGQLCACGCHA